MTSDVRTTEIEVGLPISLLAQVEALAKRGEATSRTDAAGKALERLVSISEQRRECARPMPIPGHTGEWGYLDLLAAWAAVDSELQGAVADLV